MAASFPHLNTDQVAAFVELARHGQIRGAAGVLGITEQGVRNRLLALEAQLGVELYRKSRGPRRSSVLTDQGRRFLPHAIAFLERVRELCQAVEVETSAREIHVAASQYLTRKRVSLGALADERLILYERGSTGRQHVLDAFHERRLAPQVSLETTSTETIVSMVEAGLGVSIVPLLPGGAVTRGRDVAVRPLADAIRPIHSGVLMRRGERPAAAASQLIEFTRASFSDAATG